MRYLTTILFALILAGCAASGTAVRPTPETVKGYEVGNTYEANTGSEMLSGGRIKTLPSYSPREAITPPGRGIQNRTGPELTPSQRWKAVLQLEDGGYLIQAPESYDEGNQPSIAINEDGSVKDNGWYHGQPPTNVRDGRSWPDEPIFEEAEPQPLEGSFEFKILYSGKDGQTVRMTYREFLDGMQRADYSQDLSYNIAEEDTISYRSIRMHVKEATSSSIRYEVLEDGGLPWLPQR